jgi:Carbamoyltransferase C-terminus
MVARRDPDGVVTVPARPHIVIPAVVRRRCGLRAGDQVLLAALPGDDTLAARLAAELRGLRFDDLFGGLQVFTEDLLTRWAESAVRASGVSWVLAGGGVFMNVKASKRIAASPSVDQFGAFPSCGDESLALGAYYLAAAGRYGQATVPRLAHCYLGDDITPAEARTALTGTPFAVEEPADLPAAVAGLLAGGQVVARCAGRMEFGARALGNRSILADPGNADLPRLLNQAVKPGSASLAASPRPGARGGIPRHEGTGRPPRRSAPRRGTVQRPAGHLHQTRSHPGRPGNRQAAFAPGQQ